MLVRVHDPSSFGLVRLDGDNRVVEFMEKPSAEEAKGVDTVSGGAYVLERSVLELLEPGKPASIERDVFPRLVGHGLHGHVGQGYWLDIGTPARYLDGSFDLLEGTVRSAVSERLGTSYLHVAADVDNQGRIIPAALVESGCRIGRNARVGGRAVLQHDVVVGPGSEVEGAIVLAGARIGAGCVIRDAIVGPGAVIGENTIVEGHAVIGEGVEIGAENVVKHGARIFPGVTIPDGGLRF
jgi:mannose-1-phosphate guanylyltransferase